MSNLVSNNFVGLGLDLHDLNIDNERPDGNYLDEKLNIGVYSCVSGDGRLYFGITPCFPWEQDFAIMPQNVGLAKHNIAAMLLRYLENEQARLKEEPEEYEEELENELPTMEDIIGKITDINDSWVELR